MSINKQRGVILVVALVLLLVVTLLGVATMGGAALNVKMTNNSQERQQAFNSAEAALSQAEASLMSSTGPAISSFNSSCNGGLCFFGVNAGSTSTCNVIPSSNVIPNDPWTDATLNVWTNTGHSLPASTISNDVAVTARYIIEFRCYGPGVDDHTSSTGSALFRITARGYSVSKNAEVMLQSTFRKSM